jgi:amino-acid N-acetyltransferase
VPGSYWTRERAEAAADAMTRSYDSPAMQQLMDGIATASDMDEVAASGGIDGAAKPAFQVDPERVLWRRARSEDIPQIAQLIVAGHLPPFFIEEWLGGFAVAEQDATIIATGGAELYGTNAVIRSIVVDEAARGLRLGRKISELLIADVLMAGATDIYLFTGDAHAFWQHLGFQDLPLGDWAEETRPCWQWQFMRKYGHTFAVQVYSMWKKA